jgi:decaprenylphospho-beta-D-ribofuranose 2-oxidase
LGEHAGTDEAPSGNKLTAKDKSLLTIPFHFPGFVLNGFSVKVFNAIYYLQELQKEMDSVVHYDGFFYPLDSILSWNKIYGKKDLYNISSFCPLNPVKKD